MIENKATNDLVQRDQSLLGLSLLLDPNVLKDNLTGASNSPPKIIDKQYIRYKPETNCLVRYSSDSDTAFPTVYAKAYGKDFAQKLAKHRRRVARGWVSNERFWALPEYRILIRQFPLDDRLRSLSALVNPVGRRRLLRRLFRQQLNIDAKTLKMLAYKPERRFVAKISSRRDQHFVLKFYGDHAFNRTVQNLHFLKSVDYPLLPPLIGKSKYRRVLALGWRPGKTVRELLVARACPMDAVGAIGDSLATLHQLPVPANLPCWNLESETKRLQSLAESLGFLVPAYAMQTRKLCDQICSQLEVRQVENQVVHGDFHSKQILIDNDNVWFLDPDELAVGPPQLDVGTFIAHLYRDGLSARISLTDAEATVDRFVAGYRKSGGNTDAIALFTAMALLKFSHHPFRAGEKHWDVRIQLIINMAQKFVGEAGRFSTAKNQK